MTKKQKLSPDAVAERLLKNRTIPLFGEITKRSVGEVADKLCTLQLDSSAPITLLINSSGGSGDAAFRLCDMMTCIISAPVRGVVIGQCSSAATFILLHCTERWGTENSSYVIHSGTMSGFPIKISRSSSWSLKQLQQEVQAEEERMIRMYMRKLRKPRRAIEQLVARGDQEFNTHLLAEEALEKGLITKIVRHKLGVLE